jgi:nucleotide-binding universal stress UspA family protein
MKRLLVCLDASPRAKHVLAVAVDLATRSGARVHLFRTVGIQPELPSELLAMSPNDLSDVLLGNAKKDLDVLAKDIPAEVFGGTHVHIGTPWDGICRAAKEHEADLVVIGAHGYGTLDRLLGTTASKVVNHIDRSVMVVREPASK